MVGKSVQHPAATLLTNYNSTEWHEFCADIDQVFEGLVSPAPESFHVVHSLIARVNRKGLNAQFLHDLNALSSFLVKPNYTMELYKDSGVWKWKLVTQTPGSELNFGHLVECHDAKPELHHEYSLLTLSQMALDLATESQHKRETFAEIHDLARQAEKRLSLTIGSDLRGPTSSDACFNFALAGVQHMDTLFQSLCCIGIHELKRTGFRASFQSKHVLHMVEKFAASDIRGKWALELYHVAGVCLERKGFHDVALIESLKNGNFGFQSQRPLLWLWRFSSRQRKMTPLDAFLTKSTYAKNVEWTKIFHDSSKPLIVDVGSGMGSSLLNLSTMNTTVDTTTDHFDRDGSLRMSWSEYNYAGADLNQAMINFGMGIISRDTILREGRVHFFHLSAEEFLYQLQHYPGGVALIMINFPSPYQLEAQNSGNSQLPSKYSDQFMVTMKVLQLIATLLMQSDRTAYFLFQTKCEDVAVHVKDKCLALGTLECVVCKNPVKNVDHQYAQMGKRPKRVDQWLKVKSTSERAEGDVYSCMPLLPEIGQPETESQCIHDSTVVHRCLFKLKT
eukprot:CCRYP_007114-RA/>CCRYP_007114-RA protein AED:0.04 eAED:0.04 QI:0/0/0/1/1/0.5/2/0/561